MKRTWARLRRRRADSPTPTPYSTPRHSPEELERQAVEWGTRAGEATSEGRHHADTIAELPGRRLIAETCTLRLTDVDIALHEQRTALRAEADAAARGEADAVGAHEREAAQLDELDRAREAAPPDRGPHWTAYLLVLGLLAAAEFPTVRTALQMFPADRTTRLVLAIALSLVLACGAHYLAKTVRTTPDARVSGPSPRAGGRLSILIAVFAALALGGLVVMMGFTRTESFGEIADLTGGAFRDPRLTGWMLFALQVTLLAIALAVAFLHADGDETRRLQRARNRSRKAERAAAAQRDATAGRRAALSLRLDGLPELERAIIASERQLRERVIHLHDAHYAAAASRRPMAPAIPLRDRKQAA